MGSLIVIGAGFSQHAGLPLGDELFSLVIEEAKRRELWTNIIEPDIQKYLYYLGDAKGLAVELEAVNYEDFLAFLDYEHYLGLKGSDTWSEEGNRSQLAIRNLIAFVLHDLQQKIAPEKMDLYEEFVDRLAPGDFIYSFNYDTLLESAMKSKRVPYRLFPDRFTSVHTFGATPEPDEDEVVLIKVHGSIDWFDVSRFESAQEQLKTSLYYVRPRHLVFEDPSLLMPEKIVTGLYWPHSPLQNIYRVGDLDTYFSKATFVSETPLIVAPSLAKTLYLQPLKEFWDGFSKVGAFNSRVGVIGFSMPFQDDYILQPIYNLLTNFQRVTDLPTGMNKSNLKMIDYRQSEADIAEYHERFRYVDWSVADAYFDGFDYDAIELFFS